MDLNDCTHDIEVLLDGTSKLSTGLETLKLQNESMLRSLSTEEDANSSEYILIPSL